MTQSRKDGIEIQGIQYISNHEHEIGKPGFEKHFRSYVLDKEVDFVDRSRYTRIEGEEA